MDVALRVYYSTVKGRLFYPYDQRIYYPTVKGRLLYGCGTKGLLFDGDE